MDDAPSPSKKVCVAVLAGARGVRGAVRLKLALEEPGTLLALGPLTLEDGAQVTLSDVTVTKNQVSARMEGVTSREQAQALKGTKLYADPSRLPAPAEDEYYYRDLAGLTVLQLGGLVIGRVEAVQDYGAGDLLEIRVDGRKDTVLLPFTEDYVPQVEVAEGFLVIDPPDGWIEDGAEPDQTDP